MLGALAALPCCVPVAGRWQGRHGRQLLPAAAAPDQATKDKFMGLSAAGRAEHTGALWSWGRQHRAALASGSGVTTSCCTGPPSLLPAAPGMHFHGALFCSHESWETPGCLSEQLHGEQQPPWAELMVAKMEVNDNFTFFFPLHVFQTYIKLLATFCVNDGGAA